MARQSVNNNFHRQTRRITEIADAFAFRAGAILEKNSFFNGL